MKIFTVILLLLLAGDLPAGTYYVTNVSELNTAVAAVQPGDSIIMKNQVWLNTNIVFKANGTEQDSIYLVAETSGEAVLSGTSNLRIAGNYLVVSGLYFKNGYSPSGAIVEFRQSNSNETNHSRLTNCAIVEYNPPSSSTDYKWISLYGTHNRVDQCYIRGKKHAGTTLVVWLSSTPNHHKIDNNYFAHRPPLGVNGGETIRVGTSDWSMYDSFTLVERNYFEECDGEIEIISNKSCENIYRYNTFYKCNGTLTLRHGNRCTVESNFFIGENKSNTGGVRIIGEDHKVYNNYFTELTGSGFRSALSMVNGIPNSPLNEYFQVKNATVLFNTFINNRYNFTIGAGASSTQNLPPENSIIANNIVKGSSSPLIDYDDDPINLQYLGNIMFGASLGIAQPGGITITDPMLYFANDSLYRPQIGSPAIDSAKGDFSYVAADMDGQYRAGAKDIGADQISSDPVINRPLKGSDVGPTWLSKILSGGEVTLVEAGEDSLLDAVKNAQPYDIIELATSGGIYSNSEVIIVNKPLTIKAADGLESPPVLQSVSSSSTRILIEIRSGGSLYLNGIVLDGMAGSPTPAKYLIRTDDDPMNSPYILRVENCTLKDANIGNDGHFFRGYPGTTADSIIFRNCLFTNAGKEGIRLNDESEGSGKFNVKYFEIYNSTFWNIQKEAVSIYGGDTSSATASPKIKINHATFDNCGDDSAFILNLKDCDGAEVVSSIFTNSTGNFSSILISGGTSKIHYSNIFNSPSPVLDRGAVVGGGMLYADPLYSDAENGNFTLANNSPVINRGHDFYSMGDLRWVTSVSSSEEIDPENIDFSLSQNYPNPFNPSTVIHFSLPEKSYVKLEVFDIRGVLIEVLVSDYREKGNHSAEWYSRGLSSGVYFYRIISNQKIITRKMSLIK